MESLLFMVATPELASRIRATHFFYAYLVLHLITSLRDHFIDGY